jgi:hypothetical protein
MTTTIGKDNAEPTLAETIDAGNIDPTPLMTVEEIQQKAKEMAKLFLEQRNNFIEEVDDAEMSIMLIGGQIVETLNFWLSEQAAQYARLHDRAQVAEIQLAGAQANNKQLVETNQKLNNALTEKILSGAAAMMPTPIPGPGRRR